MITWPQRLCMALSTTCGLILAITPLAMWIAPSFFLLVLVIGIGLLAALSAYGLNYLEDDAGLPAGGDERLDLEQFLARLQDLHPMSYHHGRRDDSRFHATMADVPKLVRGHDGRQGIG